MSIEAVHLAAYYQQMKQMLEKAPEATNILETTKTYLGDFNLEEEFKDLSPDSLVLDVGCAYGAGTQGLQDLFPARFVGVEPISLPPNPDSNLISIQVINGSIENLAEVIRDAGLPKPRIVLLHNVMQFLKGAELLDMVPGFMSAGFRNISDVLPVGGRALIYDADLGKTTYHDYLREIKGSNLLGNIKRSLSPSGFSRYLRIVKRF